MEDSETAQQLAPDMALSPVEDQPGLYIGGLWALRRSDALTQRNITHVLSLFPFEPSQLKNLRGEPWDAYGKGLKQLTIDIHDVDDEDLLVELPQAVRFIHQGLTGSKATDQDSEKGGVFVHCAAGKSRSASVVIAYLLWRHPSRFDPSPSPDSQRPRRETATEAVTSALALLRRTRPMVDPNDGFMSQLALWWEMGCPADKDMDSNPLYQRWAYKREVMENTAVGQAPPRLRFEDEEQPQAGTERGTNLHLRCKKCRRTLTTSPFIIEHNPGASPSNPCPHVFIEPLSWMRDELEKGQLSGRLLCPNARCGAGVGRYDWKGFKCSCGEWVTPALSLQRARVDEVKVDEGAAARRSGGGAPGMGIRMPPGLRGQGGNL
ncbi:dual specificity phosphatase, catalytic domain-containing protein [Sarocladium implicatum]|nr:dual specificity phosphatase, catalytic domain-containing protein [Sarocladium implicatum]